MRQTHGRAGLILLAASLLAACAASRPPGAPAPKDTPVSADSSEPAPPSILFVARRKWHIDVGFATDDLSPALAAVARGFPGAKYLFFGFGDEHYLLSKNKTPAMLGALLPGPGMVLVTAIENSPQQAFGTGHVLEIEVAAPRAQAAKKFIVDSMADPTAPYAEGPYDGSLYFTATARYSALHTCNTWAAEVLESAGLKVRSRLVVFAGQLWHQARKFAAPRPPASASHLSRASSAPERSRQSARLAQSQGGGLPF